MRPADIAWLFRQHVDMQPAMRALRQCGVPYQVAGGRGFFQEREIKDALALLAAIEDPDDSQAVLRCLTLPGWGVTTAGRVALVRAAHQHDVPAGRARRRCGRRGSRRAWTWRPRSECVQDIHELHAASQREDVRDLFQLALEASGFLGIIDEQSGVARLQMGANLNKLGELLETFADWSDDRRVSTALRYLGVLRDSREGGELPSIEAIEDGVVLLTAHGSKGLEWPVVFLSRCTERRWQGRTTSSSDLQLPDDLVPEPPPPGDVAVDEERRLFYVASTRARDRLVYTWARSYPQPSSEESCTPFLTMAMSLRGGSVLSKELPADSTVAVRAPRPAGAPVLQRLSIAVSDLGVFRSCPRRYNYLRRWHLPVRPDARSWYGTMIHEVLRSAATRRIAGEAVSGDVVASMWHAAWEQSRGPKGRHAELRAHGEEQLRRYLESPGWIDTTIDQVEEPVTISLDHADAAGRFDRVDTTPGRHSDRRRLQDGSSQGGGGTALGPAAACVRRGTRAARADRRGRRRVPLPAGRRHPRGRRQGIPAQGARPPVCDGARAGAGLEHRIVSTEALALAVSALRLPDRVRRGPRRCARRVIVGAVGCVSYRPTAAARTPSTETRS